MTDIPTRGRGRPRRVEADSEILEAARVLLLDGGYRALSLDEVARQAGTAKSSIYRRWPSKAALVAELIRTQAPAPSDPADPEAAMLAFESMMRGPFGPAVGSLVGEAFDGVETRAIVVSLLEPYRHAGDERIAAMLFRSLFGE
jgi:AcrR family transcriptional regulator